MANPFPFVAGSILEAAQLNGIGEAWTSYTPTVKGGATTIGQTIVYAKYAVINKCVFVQALVTATSGGAASGAITFSLPVTALTASDSRNIGTLFIKDSGTAFFMGAAMLTTTTTVMGLSYNSGGQMGAASPTMTIASGDQISISVMYEIA